MGLCAQGVNMGLCPPLSRAGHYVPSILTNIFINRHAVHVHSGEVRHPHPSRTALPPDHPFYAHARSPIHQNIKDKIVASTEQDTVHIFRTLHNTARVFKNSVAQQVVAIERRPGGAKFEDVRELVSGQRGRLVYEVGDPERGIWSAGIVLGLTKDVPTCEELLRRIEVETEEAIDGLVGLRVPRAQTQPQPQAKL